MTTFSKLFTGTQFNKSRARNRDLLDIEITIYSCLHTEIDNSQLFKKNLE